VEDDVILNWDAVPPSGATLLYYKVYRDGALLATTTQTSYTDLALANGSYEYYVSAQYSSGESLPTNTVQAVIEIPYAPQNLDYEVTGDDVALTWDPPPISNRSLLGYQIYRNDAPLAFVTGLSYDDNDLNNGNYNYYLIAHYDSGNSSPSNTVTAPVFVPYVPTGVTVTNQTPTSLLVSWTAPDQMEIAYRVYRNGAQIAEIGYPLTTTYLDSDLANGTYSYQVAAVYPLQVVSPLSDPATGTVLVAYSPQSLTASVDGTTAILNWTAPADLNGFLLYKVYVVRNSDPYTTIETVNNWAFFYDLTNADYHFQVTALYGSLPDPLESAPSNEATITVAVAYPPTNLTGYPDQNSIQLNWNAPVDLGGWQDFTIFRNNVSYATTAYTTFTDSDLANGQYFYRVVANYSFGSSEPSNEYTWVIHLAYPPQTASVSVEDNDVLIQWTPPLDTLFLMQYHVYRDGEQIASTIGLSWTDLDLPNGNYSYEVTADYDFESEPTPAGTAHVEIIHMPTGLQAVVSGTTIQLTWNAVADPGFFEEYLIYVNDIQVATSLDTTHTLTDQANGFYLIQVSALYQSGESDRTFAVDAIILIAYPPQNPSYFVSEENVVLQWEAPSDTGGLSAYRVYRDAELLVELWTLPLGATDGPLLNGVYTYQITAVYDSLESDPAPELVVQILMADAAEQVQATLQEQQVLVSWSAPSSGNVPDGYQVWFLQDNQQNDPESWILAAEVSDSLSVYDHFHGNLQGDFLWAVVAVYGSLNSEPAFSNLIHIEPDVPPIPTVTKLLGNYPNPFNPHTRVVFWLKNSTSVRLEIYNQRGQLVRSLIKANLEAGEYAIPWDGKDDFGRLVASGVYFCTLSTPGYNKSSKMLFLK